MSRLPQPESQGNSKLNRPSLFCLIPIGLKNMSLASNDYALKSTIHFDFWNLVLDMDTEFRWVSNDHNPSISMRQAQESLVDAGDETPLIGGTID